MEDSVHDPFFIGVFIFCIGGEACIVGLQNETI